MNANRLQRCGGRVAPAGILAGLALALAAFPSLAAERDDSSFAPDARRGAPGLRQERLSPARGPSRVRLLPPPRVLPHPPSRVIIEPRQPFRATIWTDRQSYYEGDPIRIHFRATRDAYIYIFDTDTHGVTRQLFPNFYDRDNFVGAGQTSRIPDRSYSLTVTGPGGREYLDIVAVAERYSCLTPYERFRQGDPFPRREGGRKGLLQVLEKAQRRTGGPRYPDEGPSARSRRGNRVAPSRVVPHGVVIDVPRYDIEVTAWAETSFLVRARAYQQPAWEVGHLRISSDPSHAEIYVDGERKGQTSETVPLDYGWHKVAVEKSGYAPLGADVLIDRSSRRSIHFDLRRGWWDLN